MTGQVETLVRIEQLLKRQTQLMEEAEERRARMFRSLEQILRELIRRQAIDKAAGDALLKAMLAEGAPP